MLSEDLSSLIAELRQSTGMKPQEADTCTLPAPTATHTSASSTPPMAWFPREPRDLKSAGVTEPTIEAIALKFLLNAGVASARKVAEQIRLPFAIVNDQLRRMKSEQLVAYRRSAGVNDYEHELTPEGYERAGLLMKRSTYFGAAPVPLKEYCDSVTAQSLLRERPTEASLRKALGDLQLGSEVISQLGQALMSVAAVFLYGNPGNGKTSMAERLTQAFGKTIWLPRAITIGGEIVRLYDPTMHEIAKPPDLGEDVKVDARWVCIERPTVVVGGELTMESLELCVDAATGVLEAPVQLKSNCGTLVVDDFGRQRMSTTELLNRWIVPLEKQYDFLNTPSGKKIKMPFEQLLVFATNLVPEELVDEAFLRRIPYKIEARDPSETEFVELFHKLAAKMGMECDETHIQYLVEKHYRAVGRTYRFCQPRDLLNLMRNYQRFHQLPPKLTTEMIDAAARNYFAVTSAS